jgi:hypothetical protein
MLQAIGIIFYPPLLVTLPPPACNIIFFRLSVTASKDIVYGHKHVVCFS